MKRKQEKKNIKKIERLLSQYVEKHNVKTLVIDGDPVHRTAKNHHKMWRYERPNGLSYFAFENGKMLTPEYVYREAAEILPDVMATKVTGRMSVAKIKDYFYQAMASGEMMI